MNSVSVGAASFLLQPLTYNMLKLQVLGKAPTHFKADTSLLYYYYTATNNNIIILLLILWAMGDYQFLPGATVIKTYST